jgi:enoyl-[acyl-carrier protein] reductase I
LSAIFMKLLEGKRAVVAGVANKRSIAWGIARAFHEHGAQVALTCVDSSAKRVAKLAREIETDIVVPCDVRDDAAIEAVFDRIGATFDGKVDILVHSIAYARLEDMGGEFIAVNREGWNLALEVSAYSLVAMARAARPFMINAGGGSILTLSFVGGARVTPSYNMMGIAKAALECAVRYLAYDLGPDKIRVNALSPGPIQTASSMVVDRFEDALDATSSSSPLLENVTAEDVGNMAVFYASDLSRRITGYPIPIDSGMSILAAGSGAHPRARERVTDGT